MIQTADYIVIGGYLIFLVALGRIFSRLNRNTSDYIRGGGRSSWWMTGMSVLMTGITAVTFTGGSGNVFVGAIAGLIIPLAHTLAFFIAGFGVAAWLRQTRAYTVGDIARWRFGPEVEQFNVYLGLALQPLYSGIALWALGVFISSILGISIEVSILGLGAIVVFYSVTGGKWAVMATDFLQGTLALAIVLTLAVVCLIEVGGPLALLERFHDPALQEAYSLLKEPGQFPADRFTWDWVLMSFIVSLVMQLNLGMAHKFLSAKDGKEANKSALSAGLLKIGIMPFLVIPPLVGRVLYHDEVMALPMDQPETGVYAYVASQLLPSGLMGVVCIAVLAATMSSLDTGLNNTAGIVVRNLLPPLFRLLGKEMPEDKRRVTWAKVVTALLGFLVVGIALYLANQTALQIFDAFLVVGSVVGLPFSIVWLAALFIRRLPRWSFFVCGGIAMLPNVYDLVQSRFFEASWNYSERCAWVLALGVAAIAVACLFERARSRDYQYRVDRFFENMRTPIDFEKEIGGENDKQQLAIMGKVTLVAALCLTLLLIVPNDAAGRLAIAAVVGIVGAVGAFMLRASSGEKEEADRREENPDVLERLDPEAATKLWIEQGRPVEEGDRPRQPIGSQGPRTP